MRGKQAPKRKIENDLKYGDKNIAKFINYVMVDGKRSVAQGIVYDAFDLIRLQTKHDPRHIFGGANYQVPFQVRGERRFYLGCNWVITAAKERKGRTMAEKLAGEILDASNGEGASVRKRETVHKMAEANKAFAHFSR
jgi:small subunit ribosomal protein S7